MSSELENVKSQVQLTASTIDDAAKATQTAYSNADEKKERLNALGVHASYQGLAQACEKLQQAMGTLSTAHSEATKANAELHGVESTMPIPESIPKLSSAVSELGTSTTSLAAASELVTNAKTDAEQVGVEGIVAVCQGALDMIDTARSTITTTSNAVTEYQKRLEQEARELTDLNTGANAAPSKAPAKPHAARPRGVPENWSHRKADSGNGQVWQRPGSAGNADMVRVMEASQRYPRGYVRFYNSHGQPISLNGKPGSRAETHIPIASDGTFETPQGWHHD